MEDMEEFINNMNELCQHDTEMPARLVRNLIKTKIKNGWSVAEPIIYPTRIVTMQSKPKSHDIVEMYLDNGWQLDFIIQGRNHTATIVGAPPYLFSLVPKGNSICFKSI